jgi:hypothetical protein
MLVRPFVSCVCLLFAVSLPACETLKSVSKLWQAAQKTERKSESESEIAMCDRMQMYNIMNDIHVLVVMETKKGFSVQKVIAFLKCFKFENYFSIRLLIWH